MARNSREIVEIFERVIGICNLALTVTDGDMQDLGKQIAFEDACCAVMNPEQFLRTGKMWDNAREAVSAFGRFRRIIKTLQEEEAVRVKDRLNTRMEELRRQIEPEASV